MEHLDHCDSKHNIADITIPVFRLPDLTSYLQVPKSICIFAQRVAMHRIETFDQNIGLGYNESDNQRELIALPLAVDPSHKYNALEL